MNRNRSVFAAATGFAITLIFAQNSLATFHLMQIEQVIGGVNGDTTAQAIQLRMRNAGQTQMQSGKLVVRNSFGTSPIVVATFSGPVPNQGAGTRVLIASPNFSQYTIPTVVPDQTMAALIPASYLTAGSLTFEDALNGTIYWRLSWGGAMYFGSHTGSTTNDANGNFGPAFAGALPSSSFAALRFTGAATALSTSNSTDYALTTSAPAPVFTNNAGATFTVGIPVPSCATCPGDLDGNSLVDGADIQMFISCFLAGTPGVTGCVCADQDDNGTLDDADVDLFVNMLVGNTSPESPCS